MKNFTAAMLLFDESVVSNSVQSKTVKKSEAERFRNNRANLFSNISTRNFLWRFYSIFLDLLRTVKGRVSSMGFVLTTLGKYRNYLDLVTGSRVYLHGGEASINGRNLIIMLIGLLTINSQTIQAQCTGITGTVFRDFNLNGKKDAYDIGLAGVTVKTFNIANAQIGATAITTANGTYSITGATGQVRVEFSGLPVGYVSGPDGTNNSTSVQFVTANACNVDYGVNQPEDFCAKEGVQPKVAVPCFANGKYDALGTNGAGLEDALVSFAYDKTGDKATSGNAPFLISNYNKIGAVWGMAYNRYNKTLFTTAFMKRHSGFGPKGIAGLYVIQNADNNGSGYIITGINLETIAGLSAGFAGTEPTRNLQTDKTQPSDDGGNTVFNAVGKMSFGDCELSADGNTLYITNLFDKKIYAFNVSNPLAPTLIASFLVPSPGCAVASEYEPFGLKYYRGKLYVGVICTAQSSQPATNGLSSANLKATVYELNAGTFTTVLPSFSLNYDRGFSNSDPNSYAIWRPWVSTWAQVPDNIAETYPQPMLSDIEFDTDGSMILGFADRFSHQLGNANYPPDQTYTATGRVEGDVMRATKSGSAWTIENNGTASGRTTAGAGKGVGPGGGEYYFGDLTIDHDEPAMGGLLLFPGTGEIMTTTAGPINIFYSGGTRRMNNQTGDFLYTGAPIAWNSVANYRTDYDSRPVPTGDYKLYEGNNPSSFGKASGLGDMEIFCSLAPLEIGNRIWRDFDQDGIQDANEPGIGSVTVLLFKGGIQVGTTSTTTAGEYYFNDANVTGGLLPTTTYQIRVLTSQVGNTFLSPKDAGSNDLIDSDGDGTILNGYAVINLTTGVYGESNHTYDVGFSPNCPTLSNPQPNNGNVAICSGGALSLSLTASNVTSQPLPGATNAIQWVSFTSAQTNPYTSTDASKVFLTPEINLVDGTLTTSVTNMPIAAGLYYVYAYLKVVPEASINPNCRPYVSYMVTVSAIPGSPTSVTGGSACVVGGSATVSLSAVCASGTTPVWYDSKASTVALSTGVGYSPSIVATTSYYVGCKNNISGCETVGASRSAVTATVVNTPSAPTITLGNGSSSTVCNGTSVTLNASCNTGNLSWSTGEITPAITVKPSTTTTYTATCTLASSTTCASPASTGFTVTINQIPNAPTISGGGVSICIGGSATLTASGCSDVNGYLWSNGGTTNSISATSNVAGITNYTVTCKVNNCISPASANASVTVSPTPNAPSVSISSTNNNGNVCGGSATLEGNCSAGTIKWSNGAITPQTIVTVSGTYTATCTLNNCTSPVSSPLTVSFNNVPTTPTISGGGISICLTKTAILTASTCSDTNGYKWYYNGTTLLSTTNNSLTVTGDVVGVKNYTVTCTTLQGCLSSASAVASITVEDYPIAPTIINGKATICKGETLALNAICGNDSSPIWYDASNSVITNSTALSATPSINTTYSVACKSTTGCETESTKRKTIVITVNNIPAGPIKANAPDVERCGAGVLTLTAKCNTNEIPTWYASNGSTALLSTGLNYTTISISSTTTYYVGCKDNSIVGCETEGINRTSVVAKINEIPSAPLGTEVAGGFICVSGVIKLTASCKSTETVQWYGSNDPLNTVVLTSGTSYSPNLSVTTTYYIGCKSNAGCENMNARTSVTGTVNQNAPAPLTVTSNQACKSTGGTPTNPDPTSISLTATCGSNQTPEWFSDSGSPLNVVSTVYTASIFATTTFLVGCKDNNTGCQTLPANRKPVVAIVITNVSNGGLIAANQSNCGAFVPNKLTNVTLPSGSNTTLEYVWLKNSTGAIVTYDPNDSNWIPVIGGTFEYQPGIISQTTSFIRCSRSAGCNDYTGESNIIIITINPLPVAPTNVPANGSVCLGETYTISGVCASNETVKWYDNQLGLSFTTNAATYSKSYVSNALGTFSYTISCENTTKCETTVANRKVVVITVLDTPGTPTANAIKGAVCTGESYVLSASCGSGQSVQWYSVVGTTKTVITTLSFTPTTAGTFDYEASCIITASNCETQAGKRLQVSVEVKDRPTVNFTPTISKSEICLGESISLSGNCGANATAQWYDENGSFIPSSNLTSITPTLVKTYTYYVGCKSTGATGCETLPAERKPVTVKVSSIPTAPLSTNVSGGVVCGSGTVDLKATCAANETPIWYDANNASLTAALTTGSPYKVSVTANKAYYVACKNTATGCESPLGVRTSVSVTYNNKPVPVATATPNAICEGGNVKVASTTTFDKYAWSSPNGFTSSAQTFDLNNITIANAGVYTLVVTDGANCQATTTVNVIVNLLPVVNNEPTKSKESICKGESVIISAVCGNDEVAKWYDANDNFIANSTANVTPTTLGNVTATVIYFVGCKNTTTNCETLKGQRKSVSIIVNYTPDAPLGINLEGATRCDFGTVTLKAKCGAGEIPQWYNTASPAVFLTAGTSYSPNLTTSETTVFTVACKNAAGCETSEANRKNSTVTGTVNPSIAAPISVTSNDSCQYIGNTQNEPTKILLSAICGNNQTPEWFTATGTALGILSTTYIASITATTTFTVGCKDNITGCQTLSINRKPVVATVIINVTNGGEIATNQTNCGPFDPVAFTSVKPASGGNSTVEYLWLKSTTQTTYTEFNQNQWFAIAGATGITYDAGLTNNTTAYIRCSRSAGCKDYTGESNIVIITINPVPTMPSDAKIDKASICLGETYVLSGVCASGENVKWYNNQTNLVTTATSSTFTVSFTPTKTGTESYLISCVNSFGCETEAKNRKSVTIIVDEVPSVISATVNKPKICLGETFELSATCGVNQKAIWYKDSPVGAVWTTLTHTPTVIATLTYYASCKSNTGAFCETLDKDRVKVTVTVSDKPTATASTEQACAGGTIKLTATGGGTYLWSGIGTFSSTEAVASIVNASAANDGIYKVIVTNNGCTAIATTEVKVAPPIVITTITLTPCKGATVKLETIYTATGKDWKWSPNGETTPNIDVSIAGTYTVEFADKVLGCKYKATFIVNPTDTPKPMIKAVGAKCIGESIKLELIGGNATDKYSWTGVGFASTEQSPIVNPLPTSAGIYTYGVTVTSTGSCIGTATTTIVIRAMPMVTASSTAICAGSTGTLLATGADTYSWTGPKGFTATGASPKVSLDSIYTVIGKTLEGCTGTATASVTVVPAPTSTAAVTFCKGGKVTLMANGGFNATYSWTGGFTTSSIQVSTAGMYDVTVIDTSGCISKGKFFVTESAAANAIITGNTSLCASGSTKLTVNEGATGETYSWTGVGGFNSTSQMITVSTPGDYAVLVKTVEGCEGTAKVTVTAGFTPTAVCGPVCEGDSIRFTATQLRGLTYSWSKNGTFISSSADPKLLNVQKSDAGIYEVTITGFGCTATIVATLVVYERPSGLTATAINSTCDGDVSKNNGQVKLAGTFTGLKYDIVEGATYAGTKKYADATDIPENGIVKLSIANPATIAGIKYTVRIFNVNNCYTDYTVTIQQVTCNCSEAKCVPYGVTKTKSGNR